MYWNEFATTLKKVKTITDLNALFFMKYFIINKLLPLLLRYLLFIIYNKDYKAGAYNCLRTDTGFV